MNKKIVVIYFSVEFLSVVIMAAVMFWSAGRLDWGSGWTAVAVMLVCLPSVGLVMLRYQPGLMAERIHPPKSAKQWDRILVSLLRLAQLARYILAGLDQRYGWSGVFPVWLQIVCVLACLAGYALFAWALASNPFFSQVVRMQTDRGHSVAAGGPYRFVRHPSYAGMILFELAMSALLGSWWSLLAGGVCVLLFILRTNLEDRALQAELPGYKEYAQKVRFRLLPGVW